MADREEVEPTDGSDATGSSDAASTNPAAAGSEAAADRVAEPTGTGADGFDEIVRSGDFGGSHALGAGLVHDDLHDDSDDVDDDTDDDERALQPAGVAAAAGAGTVAERRAGRRPKEAVTRRLDEPAKVERTGPVKFVRESVGELRKVVYPTGQQLINYFVVVLVFVLFIIGYVSLLDLGLGAAIFRIFS